jgi:hypothetical protein
MSDQDEHGRRLRKAMSKGSLLEPGSKQRLEGLLAKKSKKSSAKKPSSELGPIERAMRDNPALTRETAEKMAEAFGF